MDDIRSDSEVAARVHVALPSLSPSDRRVANTILEAGAVLATWSISDLARESATSPSTVSRACRNLGFSNYQELKVAAAKDAALGAQLRSGEEAFSAPVTEPDEVLHRIGELHIRSIRGVLTTIDTQQFRAAVDLVQGARRIVVLGTGTSAAPAQDAAHRFLTIGLDATAPVEQTARRLAITRLGAADVAIALSYSGSSTETIALARQAISHGIPVIAITCFAKSPLTECATVELVAGGPELSFRLEALSSRIAHLTVLDAIYVAVALRDRDRADAALDATSAATSDLFL
ncbi:MurR/RpiR family transcriptional regulator [Streptomyces scopuliridis]